MIALLLLGCTTTVRFPPDLWVWDTAGFDTGAPDEDPDLPVGDPSTVDDATVTGACNGAGTALQAGLRTVGWAGGVTLELLDPDRHEVHPLLLMDSDPGGAWDEWQVGPLPVGADPTLQQPAVSTAFTCASALTWVVWSEDRLGRPVDCVAWGAATADATAQVLEQPGLEGLNCREIPAP